jgi:hypothetical protein
MASHAFEVTNLSGKKAGARGAVGHDANARFTAGGEGFILFSEFRREHSL